MQKVYKSIKYKNGNFNLEQEIEHFIKAGQALKPHHCRLEGLKHLRLLLAGNKIELKQLYENLKNMRGFSEDCKNSIIHQLVYMLMKLSCLGDKDVRKYKFYLLNLSNVSNHENNLSKNILT